MSCLIDIGRLMVDELYLLASVDVAYCLFGTGLVCFWS